MPLKTVTKDQRFNILVESLKQREVLDEAKKAAANAFNRYNKQTGKSFAEFMQRENLPARTQIVIDGIAYMWATAEASVIDPKQWFKLWQDGEITEEQYFNCLRVGKEDANNIIGEDQIATISIVQQGKTADIRRDDSNAGTEVGVKVITPEPTEPRKITSKLTIKPVQEPARDRKVILKR